MSEEIKPEEIKAVQPMEIETPVDTPAVETSAVEYPPNVHKVQRQLLAIFDPENIAKDNFFRELVERTPEGWVPVKKLSMIKRFKEILEGDLSLFESAVALAPQDFEMNEEKTQLRCIKKEEAPVKQEEETKEDKSATALMTHIELQNKRSIYAKGFSVEEEEPTEAELREFYSKYGRVVSLRLRREGQKNRDGPFKGSIFVEFETPAIAEKVIEEATEYKDLPLMNMIKYDYVEMKKVEKYNGLEYEVLRSNHRHLVEYSNGQEFRYKDIKDLVKKVHANVGRLEPLKVEGTGVIELFKTTPEEFLSKLTDQKIEGVHFFLVSSDARSHFNKIQKENKASGRGGRGGRGRGGRGGSGRGGRGGGGRGGKRENDANQIEIGNKRMRTIEEVKTSNVPTIATATPK